MPAIPWRGNCGRPGFCGLPMFFALPKNRLRRGNAPQHLKSAVALAYCSAGLARISGVRHAMITKI
jgi:hypothetical protein